MTDNEIIKALECCTGQAHEADDCAVCPFIDTDNCMRGEALALDLINRQKAEIERLEDELEQTEDAFNKIYVMNGSYQRKIDTIKSEAIKEFAERLKNIYVVHDGLHSVIDNLVKEMTEVKDNA